MPSSKEGYSPLVIDDSAESKWKIVDVPEPYHPERSE